MHKRQHLRFKTNYRFITVIKISLLEAIPAWWMKVHVISKIIAQMSYYYKKNCSYYSWDIFTKNETILTFHTKSLNIQTYMLIFIKSIFKAWIIANKFYKYTIDKIEDKWE